MRRFTTILARGGVAGALVKRLALPPAAARLSSLSAADPAEDLPVDTDVEEPVAPTPGPRPASVTSVVNVLDKSGLVPWAVHSALRSVKTELANTRGTVTPSVLDDILARAAGEPDRVKSFAASFGTRVHDAIDTSIREGYFASASPDIPAARASILASLGTAADAPSKHSVDCFLRWAETSGLELDVSGDAFVTWPGLGYRGAFDALGWTADGRAVVIDLKTSSRIHDSYALQLAAYVHAFAAARRIAARAALAAVAEAAGRSGEAPPPLDDTAPGLVAPERARYSVCPTWGEGLAVDDLADGGGGGAGLGGELLAEWGLTSETSDAASLRGERIPEAVAQAAAEAACGPLPSRRDDVSSARNARARAAMFLRPVSSVHSAVVRLVRAQGRPAEVMVGGGLRAGWDGFKAALFLRRLVGGEGEGTGLLAPQRR